MHRALIVSYYFPPFNGPGAQHPDLFYRYLRGHGIETMALTSAIYFTPNAAPASVRSDTPGILHLPRRPLLRAFCRRLYKTEMQIQVRMGIWEPGFVWAKLFGLRAAARLLANGTVDALISVSPSIPSHWLALNLKKRFPKAFWVADFTDPYVGNPFRRKTTERDRRFEREIFASADVLSANTDTALEMWQQRYPDYSDKMIVTWGGYDPGEEVRALALNSPVPVLSYVGLLMGARVPKALLESIARLAETKRLTPKDLIVEFVGDLDFGPISGLAERLAAEGWLRIHSTYVPRQEALRISGQAHYSLLLDIWPGKAGLQVPAKLYDQIRIGRPILAFTEDNSPSGRILEMSGIPHVRLRPDDEPENVDAGILNLLRLSPDPVSASECFHEKFDARALVAEMARPLRRALVH